jgi:hypothetical protein
MRRVIRRATTAALTVALLAAAVAQADTVPADGDGLTAGPQTTVDLGAAAPGEVVTWPVRFSLTCSGLSHAEPGSTIAIAYEGDQSPTGGAATATGTTIGPVPATWPAEGDGCDSPAQVLAANGTSTVRLTMPPTQGPDQEFVVEWSRSGSGLTSMTVMTFVIDVVGNTPPTLQLPGSLTAEATSAAGATVTYSASATDAEDAEPPTPACTPASGSTFALGATTVSCTATDTGGKKATGTFAVTVVDSTAPAITGNADLQVTTGDANGVAVQYGMPAVADAVDPGPSIACLPESGSVFPVGTTPVTCTARDASGNQSQDAFDVTVRFVPPIAWTATWGEPVGSSGATLVANAGRTVPIKVELFANGVRQTSGAAQLVVTSCAGQLVTAVDLTSDGGRWTGHLDTGPLGDAGCYAATAVLDGQNAGSFRIDLRGSATPSKNNGASAIAKASPNAAGAGPKAMEQAHP